MKHEWVALIPYNLDATQARIAMSNRGMTAVVLRPDMVRWGDVPPVGCFVCEGPYTDVAGEPCPGQPPGRLAYVRDA